jgi:superoxide dismutase
MAQQILSEEFCRMQKLAGIINENIDNNLENKIKQWVDDTITESNILDQDFKGKIIIAMDVWEHAYYLKHKSQRGNYINDFFRVVDYKVAEERLEMLDK